MDALPQSVSVPTPPDRGVSPSQQIFSEQVKLLYRMLPRGLSASTVVVTLLAIVFWNVADQFTLTLWLTMMAAVLLARLMPAVGFTTILVYFAMLVTALQRR